MRLISMTDFVLQRDITDVKQRDSIVKYANFLKQPLKLEIFVPCDEFGNVLEEPKKEYFEVRVNAKCSDWDYLFNNEDKVIGYYDSKLFNNALKIYKKSKEKVLFEGFKLVRFIENENPCYVVSNGENEVTFHIGLYNFSKGVKFAITIEDLIPIQPILTENAVKQIGI